MFDELDLKTSATVYASADDLLGVDDLPEYDVTIRRWQKSGAALKVRVRALDLNAQEAIDIAALIQHPKTNEWVRSGAAYEAATLQYGVSVPRLSEAQASLMRAHNPTIIGAITRFIWALSAIPQATIEALVNDLAGPAPAAPPDAGA